MDSDIRLSEKGGNTAYLNMGVWWDQKSGHIRLTLPHSKWFHTTVTNDPNSKRGNPNLYAYLTRALKEAGAPYPDINENE